MLQDRHISDHELTQAADGELAGLRMDEVQAHLSRCWKCRARHAELENAVTEFVRLQQTLDDQIPPNQCATARLRAHLAELAAQQSAEFQHWPFEWKRHAMAAALGAVGIALLVFAILGTFGSSATARSLPDSRLTPGATRYISKEQVCVVPAEDDDRAVPKELATRVFQQYGIRKPRPRAYEMDYLITPALGGADDIRNLWPQPYENGVWTSKVKDALEDYLRTLVCDGKMDLTAAQHEIASNWIGAYRKHFRTESPLPAHALFIKDRPWE